MPVNLSGEYVWLRGNRHAYAYVEGVLETGLSIDAVRIALASLFTQVPADAGDYTAYMVTNTTAFDLFLVRNDFHWALVATTPLECSERAAADWLSVMAGEIRSTEHILEKCEIGTLVSKQFNCQVSVGY